MGAAPMVNINKRSRLELVQPDPASDNGRPRDRYPELGRDVPWREVNGQPALALEVRVQSYGSHGLRRETKCPHCGIWLTYHMCNGCQAMMRMFGRDDKSCECFRDTVWIYGHCEDHRRFEAGPYSP